MVSPAAMANPITPPNPRIQFVNKDDGTLSSTGLSILEAIHKTVNGLTPTTSCNCTNVGNIYTLTPLNISTKVYKYSSFASFAFVASATSTGLVTATVIPATGALSTIPIFKTHGSAQATTGDLTINLFYVMYYVDTLNSGNGAFVIL